MRYLKYLLLAAIFLPSLQGCFPVVAGAAGAGAMMASDRRTTGTYIEDEGIEDKAASQIAAKYKDAHVNVTSFNRHVLITGEAPNEAAKADIAHIITGIQNVKAVSNELAVAGPSSFSARTSDTTVTTDVKFRLLNNKEFDSNNIKVVTEAGTVFLMGLVYHKEADAAAEIASTTSGVLRVVKVFEYLD